MDASQRAQSDQSAIWNGPYGHSWVEAQELLDGAFKPFEELLAEAASAESVRDVLDIGCGAGATTLAMARRLGPHGRCTGIDISEPLLARARERAKREATPPTFLAADAQTYPFDAAGFDLIVSRFGVMFFDDPVAAFANLRRAARPYGKLQCIVWRPPADNPFMTTAERAAAPLLPNLPPRKPDAPGQFAFADPQRVRGILEQSGWSAIDLQPVDFSCSFPEKDLVRYFTRLGPLGQLFPELDQGTQARVVETVRAAFDPYVLANGTKVQFNAACWMVTATAA